MTRRKGEITSKINEQLYPHRVAVAAPPNGFGKRLDELHKVIAELGAPIACGVGFRHDNIDFVVWCFEDLAAAEAFAAFAGGEVLPTNSPRRAGRRGPE